MSTSINALSINSSGSITFYFSFSGADVAKHLEMQTINSRNDVLPFVHRVVAYKTSSHFGTSKGYVLEDRSLIGYIDRLLCHSEFCFSIRVLTPPDVYENVVVPASMLKIAPISMRLASCNEIDLIRKAILTDRAQFAYACDKKKIDKILMQNFEFIKEMQRVKEMQQKQDHSVIAALRIGNSNDHSQPLAVGSMMYIPSHAPISTLLPQAQPSELPSSQTLSTLSAEAPMSLDDELDREEQSETATVTSSATSSSTTSSNFSLGTTRPKRKSQATNLAASSTVSNLPLGQHRKKRKKQIISLQ